VAKKPQKDITVRVRIDGLRETIAALNRLPKEADLEIRAAAQELAKDMAAAAAAAGRGEGRQAALVATTVKAMRDRVPVVNAGGARRLGRNREPAYKLLFGSEFGATRYKQYKPHLGSGSYWFFRTVDEKQAEISAAWLQAADEIIRRFGEG
jgi:hypothetical protein